MSEREYIAALERDLKAALEQLEAMRKIAAAIAANTNKLQRVAAGEKE